MKPNKHAYVRGCGYEEISFGFRSWRQVYFEKRFKKDMFDTTQIMTYYSGQTIEVESKDNDNVYGSYWNWYDFHIDWDATNKLYEKEDCNRKENKMTKEQFDKLYVGKKLVVNCDTEEKAKEFLGMAHEFGYKWRNGYSYINETDWQAYKTDMCYELNDGTYADISYFKNRNYTIATYPAHKKDFTKSDLEDGYKVVYREGYERFVMKRTETLHEYNGNVALALKWFNENLTHEFDKKYDIMRVYDRQDNLIWERIEQPVKSPQEIELEELEAKAEKAKAEIQEIADRIRKLRGE